jgi:hypothetical protein
VTSGSLPPGVTLYPSNGLLFGFPGTNGTYNFAITATNANNCTGQRAYSLLISKGTARTALSFANDFDTSGKADFAFWRTATGDRQSVLGGEQNRSLHSPGRRGDAPVTNQPQD